jgi:hypothetical protein
MKRGCTDKSEQRVNWKTMRWAHSKVLEKRVLQPCEEGTLEIPEKGTLENPREWIIGTP